MTTFYAHSLEHDPNRDHWQEHSTRLNNVANLAAEFCESFDSREWGRIAGLRHDLGKYDPDFQRKLRGKRISVEHSGQGAALAKLKFPSLGRLLAFLVIGVVRSPTLLSATFPVYRNAEN
jgi:CRISPR-associated endonuclease Cas3-HD